MVKPCSTRMHSSRMRTGRSLTVCWSQLPGEVCSLVGGGCSQGGVCSGGVCSGGCLLWGEGVCFWGGCLLLWGLLPGGGGLLPGGVCSGGHVSQDALRQRPPCGQNPGGVFQGVSAPGGYLLRGCQLGGRGVCSQGVSAPGGSAPGGRGLLLGGSALGVVCIPGCTQENLENLFPERNVSDWHQYLKRSMTTEPLVTNRFS